MALLEHTSFHFSNKNFQEIVSECSVLAIMGLFILDNSLAQVIATTLLQPSPDSAQEVSSPPFSCEAAHLRHPQLFDEGLFRPLA
jgi:hypothetical protein